MFKKIVYIYLFIHLCGILRNQILFKLHLTFLAKPYTQFNQDWTKICQTVWVNSNFHFTNFHSQLLLGIHHRKDIKNTCQRNNFCPFFPFMFFKIATLWTTSCYGSIRMEHKWQYIFYHWSGLIFFLLDKQRNTLFAALKYVHYSSSCWYI